MVAHPWISTLLDFGILNKNYSERLGNFTRSRYPGEHPLQETFLFSYTNIRLFKVPHQENLLYYNHWEESLDLTLRRFSLLVSLRVSKVRRYQHSAGFSGFGKRSASGARLRGAIGFFVRATLITAGNIRAAAVSSRLARAPIPAPPLRSEFPSRGRPCKLNPGRARFRERKTGNLVAASSFYTIYVRPISTFRGRP